MASYKITYFNFRGRAELARLLFAVTGTAYEDVRMPFEGEEWPKIKQGTPLGQLPTLTVDGTVYPQSVAIARWIANKSGLAGKTDLEKFQADVVVETCQDLIEAMYKFQFPEDESKQEEYTKAALEGIGPKMLAALEGWLDSFGKNSGYYLESGMSWADLCVFDFLEKWSVNDKTAMTKYPKLAAHSTKIGALPKVAEWIKKRPVTEY